MDFNYRTPENIDINLYKCFYKEIWVDNEYNRFGVCVENGDTVIDCGANIGVFTNYALNCGAERIILFEIEPNLIPFIYENVTNINAVTIVNGAISDRFHTIAGNEDHYNFERILEEFNISYIDFAKIDIEGWEYPLILNMADNTIQKVNKWAIEVHGINSGNAEKVLKIIERFSMLGYYVYYEEIHKNQNLGMLYCKKR